MLLKIIAFFYAFCFLASLFNPTFYDTLLHVVGFALGLGGLAGLFVVAFKKHFLSQGFWRAFSAIYVGYQLVSVLLLGGARSIIASHGFLGLVGALAMSVLFQLPILLSLWRLSFATNQSGLQGTDGTAVPERSA